MICEWCKWYSRSEEKCTCNFLVDDTTGCKCCVDEPELFDDYNYISESVSSECFNDDSDFILDDFSDIRDFECGLI